MSKLKFWYVVTAWGDLVAEYSTRREAESKAATIAAAYVSSIRPVAR